MFSSIKPARNKLHLILAASALALGALVSFYFVFASSPFDITFPIKELDGCSDKNECKAFCDQSDNFKACAQFAASHNLTIRIDVPRMERRAEKFFEIIQSGGGPGGCKSESECRAYCEDSARVGECLNFAEKHNLMPPEELNQARKISQHLSGGGQLPGGCRNKRACEAYCSAPNHFKECVAFGEQSGFIEKDELEIAKKAVDLMEKGEAPGGCQSRSACETYCSDSAHQEECVEFGKKVGFIKEKDIERIRRFTREGGPGGCKSREQCEAFCNNPANQETCLNFAKERGFIKEHEVESFKEGLNHLRIGLEQAPPEAAECLKDNLGSNIIEDIRAGRLLPGREIGEKVRACFEKIIPRPLLENEFRNGTDGNVPSGIRMYPPTRLEGPGGYCSTHREECARFKQSFPLPGVIPPQTTICPALPTVNSCPIGQEKFVAFSSPECGVYHSCRPALFSPEEKPAYCIQVITLAHDPASGTCKQFSTPCDLPAGWIPGCPDRSSLLTPAPIETLQPSPLRQNDSLYQDYQYPPSLSPLP